MASRRGHRRSRRRVADLLDGAARRAIARGAYSVAADALQRAAGFSEDAATRCRRIYGAALAAAIGGAYDRCAAMLEPLAEIDDPLLRANIRHTLAVVIDDRRASASPPTPTPG